MDTRTTASIFLSLTVFCAAVRAQQADYFQAPPPPVADQVFSGCSVFEDSCGPCAANCCCSEPWHLCPPCDGGVNFWGWVNGGFVGNTSSPASKFNGPYNAIDRSNELMLNQIYFIGEKALDCDCCGIGGRV